MMTISPIVCRLTMSQHLHVMSTLLWLFCAWLRLGAAGLSVASSLPAQNSSDAQAAAAMTLDLISTSRRCQWSLPHCGFNCRSIRLFTKQHCTAPFPKEICKMRWLRILHVEPGQFTGELPACLGELRYLRAMFVKGNPLSGEIPASLCQLRHLRALWLQRTAITKSLPDCWDESHSLRVLVVAVHPMSGELPPSLCKLRSLKRLQFERIGLRGQLPKCLCGLRKLLMLDLHFNRMTGEVPECIGELTRLQVLRLSRNSLSGSLPDLRKLQDLRKVLLYRNHFSGELEEQFCGLHGLKSLRLSVNGLTGSLPPCLGELQSLVSLHVGRNYITGSLPETLLRSQNLTSLLLEENRLSGALTSLAGMASLQTCSLANNLLEGSLPTLDGMDRLEKLAIANNSFVGELPRLQALSALRMLSVANNRFTGEFPELTGLWNLTTLVAHGNAFTGMFPDISGLPLLQVVTAHDNSFEGSLPLLPPAAKTILLHSNMFSGSLQRLGNNTDKLDLVSVVAGNYLHGPVDNYKFSSKEPLLNNRRTSRFLVNVRANLKRELLLVLVITVMWCCLAAFSARSIGLHRGADESRGAFVVTFLSECRRMMARQCCVALFCFSIYSGSLDLIARDGGLTSLSFDATYSRGSLMVIAYCVVMIFNGYALIWIRRLPYSPSPLQSRSPTWLQTFMAWVGVGLAVTMCCSMSLLNSILDCHPNPPDLLLRVQRYLPLMSALLCTMVAPRLVMWISLKTDVPARRLSVLQGLGTWVLPCAVLAFLSEDCYGGWWQWLPQCHEEVSWTCTRIMGSLASETLESNCLPSATFVIADRSMQDWTYNGSDFLLDSRILTQRDICQVRWVHPGKCTARLLDVVGTFLLKKLLAASVFTLVFLAICLQSKRGAQRWPHVPFPLGVVSRTDGVFEDVDVVLRLPFQSCGTMQLLCVTSMFSPAVVMQRVAVWVDLSLGWGLLIPFISFAGFICTSIELLVYKIVLRTVRLRGVDQEPPIPKVMMLSWLFLMSGLAALHFGSSFSVAFEPAHFRWTLGA
eukprot:TRINITY_DN31676_c0_g1_i4.p1 TRINITY_DN31676_c0_g1~~TRINITY_DN31676_c0_g1_i4.p1  ORF type:complete len:1034 (-),score=74.44 TRINITY_DN31676_c0_g1_i4:136-3237(-)